MSVFLFSPHETADCKSTFLKPGVNFSWHDSETHRSGCTSSVAAVLKFLNYEIGAGYGSYGDREITVCALKTQIPPQDLVYRNSRET